MSKKRKARRQPQVVTVAMSPAALTENAAFDPARMIALREALIEVLKGEAACGMKRGDVQLALLRVLGLATVPSDHLQQGVTLSLEADDIRQAILDRHRCPECREVLLFSALLLECTFNTQATKMDEANAREEGAPHA